MRWSRRPSVALVLIMAPAVFPLAAQAPTQQLSTETIAARAVSATVTIVTLDAAGDTLGMGSGFLVRPTGIVVTNYHVMAGATSAVVILTSGERYDRVEALDTDPGADLAILKVPGYGLPVLPTSPDLPPVGAKLVAVGNPLGLSRTVSEGIVSAVRLMEGRQVLQMSAAISPGSSGGPVLNARGEVVAVATAFLKDGQNLNFAVPVRYAMGLVQAARAPVALAQAFGDAAESAAGASSDGKTSRVALPARTTRPRPTITGTWAVSQRIAGGPNYRDVTDHSGYLFLSEHDIGIMALVPEGRGTKETTIITMQRHRSTPDGRLSFEYGGAVLDGYQTDEGFVALGETTRGEPLGITMMATPDELPLSKSSGLYAIEAKTMLFGNDRLFTGMFENWTGEAAIVFANDSVYVDLFMTSTSGPTAATLRGPVTNGQFHLVTADGEELNGSADNGRLSAVWADRETWGTYQGGLNGRRK